MYYCSSTIVAILTLTLTQHPMWTAQYQGAEYPPVCTFGPVQHIHIPMKQKAGIISHDVAESHKHQIRPEKKTAWTVHHHQPPCPTLHPTVSHSPSTAPHIAPHTPHFTVGEPFYVICELGTRIWMCGLPFPGIFVPPPCCPFVTPTG